MTVPSGGDRRGTVMSIAVARSADARGTPHHEAVSTARTGVMPEGLAVSPDGRWAASTNLEGTAYRVGDPRQSGSASLTLMRLDPASGRLTRVGDHPFNGVIPEGVEFDDTSGRFAVICFDHFHGRPRGGSVDFWRIDIDPRRPSHVAATPTGVVVPVPRALKAWL